MLTFLTVDSNQCDDGFFFSHLSKLHVVRSTKTMNETNVVDRLEFNYFLCSLFVIIEIVGLVGNSFVVVSVVFDREMRRSLTNKLIVQIALFDLMVLVFNVPDLIQFVSSRRANWTLSEFLCRSIRSILVFSQYGSVLSMFFVTIERFLRDSSSDNATSIVRSFRFVGIVYPLRSKFLNKNKRLTSIILFIWTFSLLCSLQNLFFLKLVPVSPGIRFCSLEYSSADERLNRLIYIVYKSLETTFFYVVPLILQLICYSIIGRRLCRVDKSLVENRQVERETFVGRNSHSTEKGNRIRSKNQSLKSRRSVVNMLICVTLIYFVSFSPQVVKFVLFDTNFIERQPTFVQSKQFVALVMLLVTINSASNPVVYVVFSSKFRQRFLFLLGHFSRVNDRPSSFSVRQ